MTRLLYFTRTQKRGRDEFFCLRMNKRGGIYSSDGGNMNGMPLNES